MTVRTAELLMAIATLVLSLGLMINIYTSNLVIGWIEGRGPGAGMWPFWLSLGMALASAWTLLRWFRGTTPESRSTDEYLPRDTTFIVTVTALALLVFLILIHIIGTYLALMIYMFGSVRFLGGHGMRTSIAMTVASPIFIYLLFEVALTKYLPKGLPIFEEGFLVIDNLRYEWFY
ncbi:MAG: tripartite tricarboxylate transporter TctB family protein [Silicimonas sp.]|nr:tripartite tricarboxylate transporter TctB family protein [Silicimonas sp.]